MAAALTPFDEKCDSKREAVARVCGTFGEADAACGMTRRSLERLGCYAALGGVSAQEKASGPGKGSMGDQMAEMKHEMVALERRDRSEKSALLERFVEDHEALEGQIRQNGERVRRVGEMAREDHAELHASTSPQKEAAMSAELKHCRQDLHEASTSVRAPSLSDLHRLLAPEGPEGEKHNARHRRLGASNRATNPQIKTLKDTCQELNRLVPNAPQTSHALLGEAKKALRNYGSKDAVEFPQAVQTLVKECKSLHVGMQSMQNQVLKIKLKKVEEKLAKSEAKSEAKKVKAASNGTTLKTTPKTKRRRFGNWTEPSQPGGLWTWTGNRQCRAFDFTQSVNHVDFCNYLWQGKRTQYMMKGSNKRKLQKDYALVGPKYPELDICGNYDPDKDQVFSVPRLLSSASRNDKRYPELQCPTKLLRFQTDMLPIKACRERHAKNGLNNINSRMPRKSASLLNGLVCLGQCQVPPREKDNGGCTCVDGKMQNYLASRKLRKQSLVAISGIVSAALNIMHVGCKVVPPPGCPWREQYWDPQCPKSWWMNNWVGKDVRKYETDLVLRYGRAKADVMMKKHYIFIRGKKTWLSRAFRSKKARLQELLTLEDSKKAYIGKCPKWYKEKKPQVASGCKLWNTFPKQVRNKYVDPKLFLKKTRPTELGSVVALQLMEQDRLKSGSSAKWKMPVKMPVKMPGKPSPPSKAAGTSKDATRRRRFSALRRGVSYSAGAKEAKTEVKKKAVNGGITFALALAKKVIEKLPCFTTSTAKKLSGFVTKMVDAYVHKKVNPAHFFMEHVNSKDQKGGQAMILNYLVADVSMCVIKATPYVHWYKNLFWEPVPFGQEFCDKLNNINAFWIKEKGGVDDRTVVTTTTAELLPSWPTSKFEFGEVTGKLTLFFIKAPLTWERKWRTIPSSKHRPSDPNLRLEWGGKELMNFEWIDCIHPHCNSASRFNTILSNGKWIKPCTSGEIQITPEWIQKNCNGRQAEKPSGMQYFAKGKEIQNILAAKQFRWRCFPTNSAVSIPKTSNKPGDCSPAQQKLEPPTCASKVIADVRYCNTCCCKEGLADTRISHGLVWGTPENCGMWLSAMDNSIRTIFSLMRGIVVADMFGARCFNQQGFKNNNKWGRFDIKARKWVSF